ncbi:MAG: hypothetical protein HZA46_09610 [Planctomycetales bacterium]|nr:hypothetical protein [Planctomycetales bacterium]
MTTISSALLIACVLSQAPEPPPAGMRSDLSIGKLFVPAGFAPADGRVQVIVHLHGAPAVCERNLKRSGVEAVLVNVTLNGLSGVYTEKFKNPETFQTLLRETNSKLRELKVADNPAIERVTVTSFSAGFGGVRELLKSDDIYQRIDTLVMADSIYAGYKPGTDSWQVEPKHMEGFLRFARDAAEGKKTLVISNCQLQPDGYASTGETADYLLTELGLKREAVDEIWADDWQCTSHCQRKGFRVYGFAGDAGKDHVRHLQNLDKLLRRAQ